MEYIVQYQYHIAAVIVAVLLFLTGKLSSVSAAVDAVYQAVLQLLKYFGSALTEADGNGGKPSFSRMLGVYVTLQIVAMAWTPDKAIPDEIMTIFWVTIGYAMVSKVISTASPLMQDIIKAYFMKVQNSVNVPQKEATR